MLLAAAPVWADVTPPSVARVVDRGGQISLAEPILFAFGKAEIDPRSRAELDELAALLTRVPAIMVVEIAVHSDARGMAAYNLKITDARAQAIRAYLLGRGVEAHRLLAKGYGESKPLCTDPTPACFAKNRRVEIHVIARAREKAQGAAKRSQ